MFWIIILGVVVVVLVCVVVYFVKRAVNEIPPPDLR